MYTQFREEREREREVGVVEVAFYHEATTVKAEGQAVTFLAPSPTPFVVS